MGDTRQSGERVGVYTLMAPIGAGGYGDVWSAKGPAGLVAIKFLHKHAAVRPEIVERFLRECRATDAIDHPGIPKVHEFSVHAGQSYLVLDHLVGEPLRDVIQSNDRELAFQALVGALPPLDAAHAHGFVHRDIKPENIFVSVNGTKLIDFGISSSADFQTLTMTGSILGTPHYTAPEQAKDAKRADPAADIWSIGVIAFEIWSGERPFDGDGPGIVLSKICTAPIPELPADVPELIRYAIRSCLNRDASARPSAAALHDLFQEAMGGHAATQELPSIPAPSVPEYPSPEKHVAPKPKTVEPPLAPSQSSMSGRVMVTAAALVCCIVAVFVFAFWPASPQPESVAQRASTATPSVEEDPHAHLPVGEITPLADLEPEPDIVTSSRPTQRRIANPSRRAGRSTMDLEPRPEEDGAIEEGVAEDRAEEGATIGTGGERQEREPPDCDPFAGEECIPQGQPERAPVTMSDRSPWHGAEDGAEREEVDEQQVMRTAAARARPWVAGCLPGIEGRIPTQLTFQNDGRPDVTFGTGQLPVGAGPCIISQIRSHAIIPRFTGPPRVINFVYRITP